MSIRPIDLQVMIPRVTEVGKVQQINDRQMLLDQQQFADQWVNIADRRNSQVQNIHKAEAKKVHIENQNQNSSPDSGEHNETGQSSEENNINDFAVSNHPSDDDPVRGHIVDIKT